MKPNIIGGPIGSDTDLMLDVYMTRDQREAYERLRRDAARYRWLRNESGNDLDAPFVCGVHGAPMGDDGWLTGELLDAAIDAAMNGANA